ncbi:MAG TPA: transketolase C-terminal domain-containing protein [Fodinibius sp.]|nr:transketolase C-terminal domain-containing protein [Fodinibius sp.]
MRSLEEERANQYVFAETLEELAETDSDLLITTSDSRGSGKLVPSVEKNPDQIVEVGIAEQNLVGISAGLASTGKKVFAISPSYFLTARSLEQIKNDVAYSDHPVKLVGISAGVSYGDLGSTHHSIHELAVLRAINNMTIIVPADNFETREATKFAYHHDKPVFLRFGKKTMYALHDDGTNFEAGKAITVRKGADLAFIANGETVYRAMQAAMMLEDEGVQARVVSMHTIKPFDRKAVSKSAKECGAIITVEEHMINGGLGEACSAHLLESGFSVPFKRMGIPDEYTVTGPQNDILTHYGISAEGLKKTAIDFLKTKVNTLWNISLLP